MEAREPKFRNPVKTAQFAEPNTGVNAPAAPAGCRSSRSNRCRHCLRRAWHRWSACPEALVDPQQAPPLGTPAAACVSAQRYAAATADVSRSDHRRMDRDQQFRNQSGGRRDGGSRFGRRLVRSAGDVDPARQRAADGWERHGARGRRSARTVPGREHRLSSGRPGAAGPADVLRRSPPGGRGAGRGNEQRRPDLRRRDQAACPDSGAAQPEPIPGLGRVAHVQPAGRAQL